MAVELSAPKGHGLVRVAHNLRHHVGPREWADANATDYWLTASSSQQTGTPSATAVTGLSAYGWTATSLAITAGAGGDFLSSSDIGTPMAIVNNAASDLLASPVIFGDYARGLAAAQHLGYMPTKLILDAFVTFGVINTTSDTTGFGFFEDGGSAIVANDHLAYIVSDGTNFVLRNDTTSDTGAVADTNPHLFRIKIDATNCEWFIDGTSQGTIATKADEFPVGFGAGALASTGANFFGISWVHIFYE